MGMGDALWGGFAAFYSIWQLCILQFSPFFLAFIVGLFFAAPEQPTASRLFRVVLPPSLVWTLCFTLFYSLLIASALNLSRPLITNLGVLRVLAGFLILLVGLFLGFCRRLPAIGRMYGPTIAIVLALIIGFSFAMMYSPCITPMLSDIMALASQRSTVGEGWVLAFFYGLGTCIAMGVFSVFRPKSAGCGSRTAPPRCAPGCAAGRSSASTARRSPGRMFRPGPSRHSASTIRRFSMTTSFVAAALLAAGAFMLPFGGSAAPTGSTTEAPSCCCASCPCEDCSGGCPEQGCDCCPRADCPVAAGCERACGGDNCPAGKARKADSSCSAPCAGACRH